MTFASPPMSATQVFGQASKLRSRSLSRSNSADTKDVFATWRYLIVAVSIVSNASLLICQQVAIRLLAPLIGSSIETWSAILGVFLLGIAIGNFLAGQIS